jgi:hypothetical protein
VAVLKLGYFALLLCTFPLLNWPFRENILELAGIKEADMVRNNPHIFVVPVLLRFIPRHTFVLSIFFSSIANWSSSFSDAVRRLG